MHRGGRTDLQLPVVKRSDVINGERNRPRLVLMLLTGDSGQRLREPSVTQVQTRGGEAAAGRGRSNSGLNLHSDRVDGRRRSSQTPHVGDA